MKLTYKVKTFRDLGLDELYSIMKLRQEVFVVEQDCPYLDADDKDQAGLHLLGWDRDRTLHAYARVLAPGVSYEQHSSIGRVVTSAKVRGTGIGKILMAKAIEYTHTEYPRAQIKISAQTYAQGFYQALGFLPVGEEYLEDNIPHIAMVTS